MDNYTWSSHRTPLVIFITTLRIKCDLEESHNIFKERKKESNQISDIILICRIEPRITIFHFSPKENKKLCGSCHHLLLNL